MDWATQTLVIVLSIMLAIFLVLSIVLIVLLIRITKQIRRVTDTAEKTVTNVSGFVDTAVKFASPAVMSRVASEFVKNFKSKKEKK
jgi:hypothetical protein